MLDNLPDSNYRIHSETAILNSSANTIGYILNNIRTRLSPEAEEALIDSNNIKLISLYFQALMSLDPILNRKGPGFIVNWSIEEDTNTLVIHGVQYY